MSMLVNRSISAPRRVLALGLGLILALAAAVATVLPSFAQEPPPPIAVEILTPRSQFTDSVSAQIRYKHHGGPTDVLNLRDASRTVVARFTVQPGAQFPWHTHPGTVIVNVAQGELVYVQAHDCVERSYPAGTAFVDPGSPHVHTAYNPTDGVTVLVATFFGFPADGPLSNTNVTPGDCDT
jgi:quercetin dioxygenase-like cupin family protein